MLELAPVLRDPHLNFFLLCSLLVKVSNHEVNSALYYTHGSRATLKFTASPLFINYPKPKKEIFYKKLHTNTQMDFQIQNVG